MPISFVLLLSLASLPETRAVHRCAAVEDVPRMSVCRLGENEFRVLAPRDEKTGSACRMPQSRIVPAFRDGRAYGFKLFAIRPRSFYALLGLTNGDVVTHINGHVLDTPEHALETYQAVKSLNVIRLGVEHAGKPRTFVYRIVRVAPLRVAPRRSP